MQRAGGSVRSEYLARQSRDQWRPIRHGDRGWHPEQNPETQGTEEPKNKVKGKNCRLKAQKIWVTSSLEWRWKRGFGATG